MDLWLRIKIQNWYSSIKPTAAEAPEILPKAQIACSLMSELGEDTKQTR